MKSEQKNTDIRLKEYQYRVGGNLYLIKRTSKKTKNEGHNDRGNKGNEGTCFNSSLIITNFQTFYINE